MKKQKKRLFIDMDGTLAQWNSSASIEEVATKGYFSSLPPMDSVVKMIRRFMTMNDDTVDVFILSSVFKDGHSITDKQEWLAKYLPEIPKSHHIFVPYGKCKSDYIKEPRRDDVLLDDFTKNLKEWHGIGIKIYNGVNGTHGTWDGFSIHSNMNGNKLLAQFDAIVNY